MTSSNSLNLSDSLSITGFHVEKKRSMCRLLAGTIVYREGNRYKGFILGLRSLAVTVEQIGGGYKPAEDEAFMDERQKDYFRRKLIAWKEEILRRARRPWLFCRARTKTIQISPIVPLSKRTGPLNCGRATGNAKLISKIDAALARLDEGTYGYCEETGEPISLKRLDARLSQPFR